MSLNGEWISIPAAHQRKLLPLLDGATSEDEHQAATTSGFRTGTRNWTRTVSPSISRHSSACQTGGTAEAVGKERSNSAFCPLCHAWENVSVHVRSTWKPVTVYGAELAPLCLRKIGDDPCSLQQHDASPRLLDAKESRACLCALLGRRELHPQSPFDGHPRCFRATSLAGNPVP